MTPQQMEKAITRLFEGQDLLAGKVAELTDDVSTLSSAVSQLTKDVSRLGSAVNTMRKEADADRKVQREAILEMRTATNLMIGFAESMATNVKTLTEVQSGTRQRVDTLERRVARIEKRTKPPKNGRDR